VEIVRIDLTHQPSSSKFVRISAKILQRFMDVKLVPTNGCASIFALAIGEVEANGDVGEVHTRELSYFSRLSQASEFNRQSPVEVFRRTTTESRRQRRVLKSLKQLQAGETLSAPRFQPAGFSYKTQKMLPRKNQQKSEQSLCTNQRQPSL
jgi:hypothetical protein